MRVLAVVISTLVVAGLHSTPAFAASHGTIPDVQQVPPPSFWFTFVSGGQMGVLDPATREIKTLANLTPVTNLVASPTQPLLFGSEKFANQIDFFNTNSIALVASVPMPASVTGMAIGDFGNRLYVAAGNEIVVVSIRSRSVEATIPLPAQVWDVAIVAQGHKLIATLPFANEFAIIDATTNTIRHYVQAGRCVHEGRHEPCHPFGIMASPDGRYAVGLSGRNAIALDAKTDAVLANVEIEGYIFHAVFLAVDPSTSTVWIETPGSVQENLTQLQMQPPFSIVGTRHTFLPEVIDAAFEPNGVGFATMSKDIVSFPLGQQNPAKVYTGFGTSQIVYVP